MDFVPEQVDLAELAQNLKRRYGAATPQGYVLGQSMFRDAIAEQLGCSELDAENLVDTMIGLGYLQFKGSPSEAIDNLEPWTISTKDGE